MSAGIKRMLAEREAVAGRERVAEAVENSPKRLMEEEAAMKMVDLAQPFIDENTDDETKWKPSQLLRIGYCIIGTGKNPKAALGFVMDHLEIARKRHKAGLDPNPFLGKPNPDREV